MRVIRSKASWSKVTCAWVMCLGLSLSASACGYLDDELAMSDEEFEASFGEDFGTGGGALLSRSYSSGCGIGFGYATHAHHSAHHHSIGRLVTRNGARATVIDMAPTHISARHAGSGALVARRVSDEENPEGSDAPFYAAGELETWGDYVEAELERARSRAGSTR